MATPQDMRRIRMKNDYKEMQNIRGSIIDWKALKGQPPYVEVYELTVNVRTIIGAGPTYRDKHVLTVTLSPNYPMSAPTIVMKTRPQPYHLNWFSEGRWCYGTWDISEGLGHHVVRMIKTLQFDPDITNPASPTNQALKDWYVKNRHRGWFPCDRQVLPDPTKSRFEIQTKSRPKFIIN